MQSGASNSYSEIHAMEDLQISNATNGDTQAQQDAMRLKDAITKIETLRRRKQFSLAIESCEDWRKAAHLDSKWRAHFCLQETKAYTEWAELIVNKRVAQASDDELSQALSKLESAIKVSPHYAPAWVRLGDICTEAGYQKEAKLYFERAIEEDPRSLDAWMGLGKCFRNEEAYLESIEYFKRGLLEEAPPAKLTEAKHQLASTLSDYGVQLRNQGDSKGAMKHWQLAVRYHPTHANSWYNLGVSYQELFKYDKAVLAYQMAIQFNPNLAEAYNNMAGVLKDEGDTERALEMYQQAALIKPDYPQALTNLGVLYTNDGKFEQAHQFFDRAIKLQSDLADAWNNLGVLQREEGDMEGAVISWKKAKSDSNYLFGLHYVPAYSHDFIYNEHIKWAEGLKPVAATPIPHKVPSPPAHRPVRVALISPDLRGHSVSFFIDALLKCHSSERIQIACYSNLSQEDTKSQYLRSYADLWRPIFGVNTEQVAQLIREDAIDILIDLTGHTAGHSLEVLRRCPAPIQMTYLGYPNSTGLREVHYRITDPHADPVSTTQKFSEQLLRLPHFLCYTPYPLPAPPVSALPALANGFVSFGSFNHPAKMSRAVWETWARVLQGTPNSRLVLKAKCFKSLSVKRKFLTMLEELGVEAYRVELIPMTPTTYTHLSEYAKVDIALDTFPYTGATTTCEALYMGVPVLSLAGASHVENVGSSILHAVGLERELLASTEDEYVEKATSLASDLKLLSELRTNLRHHLHASPLMNGPIFARNFTHMCETIYDGWVRGGGVHARADTLDLQYEQAPLPPAPGSDDSE